MENIIKFVRSFPEAQLTGSWYFGDNGPGSDWDFFMEFSEENRQLLELQGFRKAAQASYSDNDTLYVFRKNNIDVQLVADAGLKAKAQELMKSSKFPLYSLSKIQKTLLWNMILAALRMKPNE